MNTSFKVILKGNLAFGNQKSYDMMFDQYKRRLELYYKNDILLKGEDHLSPEKLSIIVPRTEIELNSDKTWKNTIGLFNELRTFAVAGVFSIWVMEKDHKNLIQEAIIMPQGDKFATTSYNMGVSCLRKVGKEEKAIEWFNKAIDKYEDYEQAYERRGVAYHRLGRQEDAILDFTKSISLVPNSDAYLGRAIVKRSLGDIVGAIADLDLAIKNAVPFQPVFWASRRIKGECHLELSQLEKAIFELQLVSKRQFKESDPNFAHRRKALETYALALEKVGKKAEAALASQKAKAIEITSTDSSAQIPKHHDSVKVGKSNSRVLA